MFCKNCGNPCADTDNVCSKCGTRLKSGAASPSTLGASGSGLAAYVPFIALGLAVLALIFGIMNLFGTYDVSVSVSFMGESMSESGPVSDLYEVSSMLSVANVLYGFILIAVAGISALYGLKEINGMPYYDQYIAKLPFGNKPLTLIGGAGAAAGILQFIMYILTDIDIYGVKASVSVNWTTWIMILLGAGLVAVDMFVLNKKDAA